MNTSPQDIVSQAREWFIYQTKNLDGGISETRLEDDDHFYDLTYCYYCREEPFSESGRIHTFALSMDGEKSRLLESPINKPNDTLACLIDTLTLWVSEAREELPEYIKVYNFGDHLRLEMTKASAERLNREPSKIERWIDKFDEVVKKLLSIVTFGVL